MHAVVRFLILDEEHLAAHWMSESDFQSLKATVLDCKSKVSLAVAFFQAYAPDSPAFGEVLPRLTKAADGGVPIRASTVYQEMVTRQCRILAFISMFTLAHSLSSLCVSGGDGGLVGDGGCGGSHGDALSAVAPPPLR